MGGTMTVGPDSMALDYRAGVRISAREIVACGALSCDACWRNSNELTMHFLVSISS
jgi:hypothetical protein